ncbi:MAG: WS/DGAT/MGAT family O-acyltransferase [Jatrophihabitans sp.]|uniref:WS/DGAT/MGAT family O-acyltransferase n=1 Tax=Jatrophihabitans sp. TaxID=1932789 RepID=UPI003F7D978C
MATLLPPQDAVFLLLETREQPMHVGGLELFVPPEGATALDVRRRFEAAIRHSIGERGAVGPLFRKRPVRGPGTLGQWAWEEDRDFDLEHHVRLSALPQPGRVLELLALVSRLHSTLLDRKRPLWEMHLIEGLDDGRFAVYFKVHHALIDGVSSLRLLSRQLTTDPGDLDVPPPWAPRERRSRRTQVERSAVASALGLVGDAAGLPRALQRTVQQAVTGQAGALSLSAPRTILNQPITGARRFAAQSWPLDRLRAVGRASGTTVNDVFLAMCSGALRSYLLELDALPDDPLIAMVPVSLHGEDTGGAVGGNSIGTVMANLATHLRDPAHRLARVHESMQQGKSAFAAMTPAQTIAMSALGCSPLMLQPLLGLVGKARPPFNLVISNVPGPRQPLFWNGARLDGLYPLSIPLDGQALNITCTSYDDQLAFGLTGCRRTAPRLQRLLAHLDEELLALEKATG